MFSFARSSAVASVSVVTTEPSGSARFGDSAASAAASGFSPSGLSSLMGLPSMNQVKEGEKVDPDQVDQVPVQGREVDRTEVVRPEVILRGLEQHPHPHADADQHVQAVQAGHEKVDAE